MDNRILLTILFVSWISVGTYAQTTTVMPTTAATTAAPTTAAPTTAAPTTAAPTTAAATTAAPATAAATTAAPTTAAPATAAATTAAPATAAPTTAGGAAVLMPNTTVETLNTTISREGCGSERLCAAEPSECDPAISGSCFFLNAKQTDGRNFEFGISGESDGYIAAVLSRDAALGGNDTTYVCANNNGEVQFFGALLDGDTLTMTEVNANSVKGSVNGKKIQCTFAATVPSASSRAETQAFALGIVSGAFNASSGTVGTASTQLRSPVVNLAAPNTTVVNTISTNNTNTTPSPNTTSHAITLQQSLTQALLITVGVLGLAIL